MTHYDVVAMCVDADIVCLGEGEVQYRLHNAFFGRQRRDAVDNVVGSRIVEPLSVVNLLVGGVGAGDEGKSLILAKFIIVRDYMSASWGIDVDELRDVVNRRFDDVVDGRVDLTDLSI